MSDLVGLRDLTGDSIGGAPRRWPIEARCVTRQPITDRRGHVYGYELLFHERSLREIEARNPHSSRTMVDTLVMFGLERFTLGSLAFVNCTAEAILENLVADLPSSMTVLELPKDLEVSPKLLRACRSLKEAGFRLALVDFTSREAKHPLLNLVDYVKVDSAAFGTAELRSLCKLLKGTKVTIVADGVDTREAFRKTLAVGIKYFQGFYFCRPESIRNTKVPANRLFHVEILRQLFRDPLDLRTLAPLVMRDASLVYRVLRLVNSPMCAVRYPVKSIESAIIILGDTTFRRIATLAIQCALNQNHCPEIVHMAQVRARFCALSAHLCQLDSDEQYLLGMLSMLPAMLEVPMETIALDLPLRPVICNALLGSAINERCLLTWIEFLERNEVSKCDAVAETYAMDQNQLMRFYLDALVWDTVNPALGN